MLYYTQLRIVNASDDIFNIADTLNRIPQVAQDLETFGKSEGYLANFKDSQKIQ